MDKKGEVILSGEPPVSDRAGFHVKPEIECCEIIPLTIDPLILWPRRASRHQPPLLRVHPVSLSKQIFYHLR